MALLIIKTMLDKICIYLLYFRNTLTCLLKGSPWLIMFIEKCPSNFNPGWNVCYDNTRIDLDYMVLLQTIRNVATYVNSAVRVEDVRHCLRVDFKSTEEVQLPFRPPGELAP